MAIGNNPIRPMRFQGNTKVISEPAKLTPISDLIPSSDEIRLKINTDVIIFVYSCQLTLKLLVHLKIC
jgi:hypothetical protein